MARMKLAFFIFCLAVIIAMFSGSKASAFTLFNDSLNITGWLRSETAFRLENRHWVDPVTKEINARLDKWDLSRCLNEIQVEADWTPTPNLLFKTMTRAYYEGRYSLDDEIYRHSDRYVGNSLDHQNAQPFGNNSQKDIYLREYHLTYSVGNFLVKAGKMQVVWGEADNARLSDIINPLDLSYMSSWRPWEEIRVPLRMIQMFYMFPESKHKYQIEVVLNPEDFKPNSFAPYGDNWYLLGDRPWNPAPFAPLAFPGLSVGDAAVRATKNGLPDKHDLSNFQGGLRLRGQFGACEMYLFNFYQRSQAPVYTSGPIAGPFGPYNPYDSTYGIRAHYPWMNTIGGSFNYYERRLATVFRGEFSYTLDMPYRYMANYLIFGSPTSFFGTDYLEKDTAQLMIGFDRPTFIRWLNPTTTFFFSGQLFQTYIFNLDAHNAATSLGQDGNDDYGVLATFRVTTDYVDAKVRPAVTVGHEVTGHNGFLISVLGFEPSYLWRIELGGRWCWGRTYSSGRFGGVKDNDEAWLRIEYKF